MSTTPTPEELAYRASADVAALQRDARTILGNGVFVSREFPPPEIRYEEPEFSLLRSTSWLYVLYYEMGRVGVDFLLRAHEKHDPALVQQLREHYALVRQLRTFFEHSLDPFSEHDEETRAQCAEWFK